MTSEDFKHAQMRLKKLVNDPGNEAKLKLYALFKQVFDKKSFKFVRKSIFYELKKMKATVGDCNVAKPGVFDVVAKAKWTSWNSLKKTPKVRLNITFKIAQFNLKM
jgi:peroxisomal 3,2-trans-enoyl-CoA isomerase